MVKKRSFWSWVERKRQRVLAVPSAWKEAGKIPVPQVGLLLLQVDVDVKEIAEKGRAFAWPRPSQCPRCQGRIWGHGFVGAFFDGIAQALFLRRYRCADCRLTLRLRPKSHWPRFQASISAIFQSLSHRLQFHRWPSFFSRQRQGHWLGSLLRKIRWYWGLGWRGDPLAALEELSGQGVVAVSRSF